MQGFLQKQFRRLIGKNQTSAISVTDFSIKMLCALVRLRRRQQQAVTERVHFVFPKFNQGFPAALLLMRFFDIKQRAKRRVIPKQIVSQYADGLIVRAQYITLFVANFFIKFRSAQMLVERKPKFFITVYNVSNLKAHIILLSANSSAVISIANFKKNASAKEILFCR